MRDSNSRSDDYELEGGLVHALDMDNEIDDEIETATDDSATGFILLNIQNYNDLNCYDNRKGKDRKPALIKTYKHDFKHQLSTWMRLNGISKNDRFVISYDDDADYSNVVKLVDALTEMGITNYSMKSDKE